MNRFLKTLKLIEKQTAHFTVPIVTIVSQNKGPYQVLVSCILSLRTKDKTTGEASARLFKEADTPRKMLGLSISNRLGWIKTKAPEETEEALKEIFPRKNWIELNTILVTFGQNICVRRCAVIKLCERVGVTRWR
ncbi:MAG: hypothetical protein NT033_06990 [Candidatus Omnitrophica bacterium]|nr:hypothetical protein [Candidatus Omnitrophota bacterium]